MLLYCLIVNRLLNGRQAGPPPKSLHGCLKAHTQQPGKRCGVVQREIGGGGRSKQTGETIFQVFIALKLPTYSLTDSYRYWVVAS